MMAAKTAAISSSKAAIGGDLSSTISQIATLKLGEQHAENTTKTAPKLPYEFLDTVSGVATMVNSLTGLPTNPPSLFVDLEGINLSRQGSISIIQIYVSSKDCTYLIDVHTLGAKAFSTAGSSKSSSAGGSKYTLKEILESDAIPKVFFDVRNDSDALFSHYDIHLGGVQDIQVMEFATRVIRSRYVNGLAKCIEKDLVMSMTEKWNSRTVKEKGLKLFTPERGGSYEVLNERPLPEDLALYCVHDVKYLPKLWSRYNVKLSANAWTKVRQATIKRIAESQSPTYNGHGKHKAIGPW